MKSVVRAIYGCILAGVICGCNGKPAEPRIDSNHKPQTHAAETDGNKDLAFRFLMGVQEGDKGKMYSAANITPGMVDASRDKLVHLKQNQLTEKQRLEYAHVLRISGEIDFFLKRMQKLFPKSSAFQIAETTAKGGAPDTTGFTHTVFVTYNDQSQAIRDKTGRAVKTLRLHLQQADRPLPEGTAHEFSFDSKDFEKMAERDFEVVSYY